MKASGEKTDSVGANHPTKLSFLFTVLAIGSLVVNSVLNYATIVLMIFSLLLGALGVVMGMIALFTESGRRRKNLLYLVPSFLVSGWLISQIF